MGLNVLIKKIFARDVFRRQKNQTTNKNKVTKRKTTMLNKTNSECGHLMYTPIPEI